MNVRNYEDVKVAHDIIAFYKMMAADHPEIEQKIRELKRDIRKFYKRPAVEGLIVKDYGIDGGIMLIPLPEDLTANNVDDYFMSRCYIHPTHSFHDCTGRPFTNWYKIIKRHGRYYAYHCVLFDV